MAPGDSSPQQSTSENAVGSIDDRRTHNTQTREPVNDRKATAMEQMSQLPRFSGIDPLYNLHKFKKNFKEVAEWFEWEEKEKFFILKRRLTGKAAEIFDLYEDKIKTSDELFDKLEDRLTREVTSADKIEMLRQFVQKPDMPVEDFVELARKKAFAAAKAHTSIEGGCVEAVAEEWLLNALLDNVLPQYRRELLRANPTTSKEFERIALLEERAYMKTKPLNPAEQLVCANVTPENNKLVDMLAQISNQMQQLQMKVDRLEKEKKGEENKSENNTIVCFKCNLPGHIARNCVKFQVNDRRENLRGRGRGRGGYYNDFRGHNNQCNTGNNTQYRGSQNNNRGFYRGGNTGRGRGNPYQNHLNE